MTDLRKCDGPGCDKTALLNDNSLLTALKTADSADYYITLESRNHASLHFHNQACLTKWTNENTKGVKR